MGTKSLWIEVKKDFEQTEDYKAYEYEGIKIFIEDKLNLEKDVLIYEKMNLPMVGRIFAAKGISVKNP